MSFGFSAEQEAYRQQVRAVLAGGPVRAAMAAMRTAGAAEPDVRPLYRELGRAGLLAPNWPAEYGGQERSLFDAAIVAEELVRAGVPDSLYVVSIQIVGTFILMAGTPEQKERLLPALARGERAASILLTEPECGSDLSSLRTTARRGDDGYWHIDGVKAFNIKSQLTDLALCAVRTGAPDSRYRGISLFLMDLDAPGVRRSVIASIADEQFNRLDFIDVRVPPEAMLGAENDGWSLLHEMLAVERTGLDYSMKSEQWLRAACLLLAPASPQVGADAVADVAADVGADVAADVDGALLADLGRFDTHVAASRLLTLQAVAALADDRPDELASATAKLYCSELGQRIAVWAAHRLPATATADAAATPTAGATAGAGVSPDDPAALLETAYREAPGLTMAGGTSDVMLQIIASLALDGLAEEDTWSAA